MKESYIRLLKIVGPSLLVVSISICVYFYLVSMIDTLIYKIVFLYLNLILVSNFLAKGFRKYFEYKLNA
jgi:hypothetical protein